MGYVRSIQQAQHGAKGKGKALAPRWRILCLVKMAIEIVDFPMKNGGSFHSYVKLPEANVWL